MGFLCGTGGRLGYAYTINGDEVTVLKSGVYKWESNDVLKLEKDLNNSAFLTAPAHLYRKPNNGPNADPKDVCTQ